MPTVTPAPHVLSHRPTLLSNLRRLHSLSLAQETALQARDAHFPATASDATLYGEQLVALDEEKARDMYLILRAMGATRVVEAGTSYGVSLLWLIAAVLDNLASRPGSSTNTSAHPPLVLGTENEPPKAQHALDNVRSSFGSSPECLTLQVGDLLETLPALNLADESIDALLLDIWAPMALPTLEILKPKFRIGAAVFIDNTKASEGRYKELLDSVRADGSGFVSSCLPHAGGFELAIWVGKQKGE
ncbi:hypothetical protein MNV49_001605 [Pseudohyphozyma bogoriensis]|nr:hypothetical protein MNV49_001605 [Pseudohyphozyma bogoriensis]